MASLGKTAVALRRADVPGYTEPRCTDLAPDSEFGVPGTTELNLLRETTIVPDNGTRTALVSAPLEDGHCAGPGKGHHDRPP